MGLVADIICSVGGLDGRWDENQSRLLEGDVLPSYMGGLCVLMSSEYSSRSPGAAKLEIHMLCHTCSTNSCRESLV